MSKSRVKRLASQAGFDPDWRSPPGDTIADILQERHWTVADLARSLDTDLEFVELLLAGDACLNEHTAHKLAECLGSTPEFWLAREAHYRRTTHG